MPDSQSIPSDPIEENVSTTAPDEGIVELPTEEIVPTIEPEEGIVEVPTEEIISTTAPEEDIVEVPSDEIVSAIGPEGGVVDGPGGVQLVVPEGAFSQSTNIIWQEIGNAPMLPEESDVVSAGKPVQITLTADAVSDAVFELVLPFKREEGVPDDQYTALRWDGVRWTTAGGVVDGDHIRVWTNKFSIFMPTRVPWARRPVSFVNNGPFDAVVMPWTYQPFDPLVNILPPGLSTVSFAPGGPGLWPNPSRFLGLPLGIYTFCIEWDEDEDLDNDGYIDIYHFILEGPSADLPLYVDENDPEQMSLAEEVRFSTDQIGKLEGECGSSAAGQWNVRLLQYDVRTINNPPEVIAYANIEHVTPPESVSIINQGDLWRYNEVVALLKKGDWISASCNRDDVTVVGVHIIGDTNDGWGRVLVDGQEVWRGNAYGNPDSDQGGFSNYIEISGLDPGAHTIQVENLGIEGDGGGIHVAMYYFGFSTHPVPAP
jgi:hypothetical protein